MIKQRGLFRLMRMIKRKYLKTSANCVRYFVVSMGFSFLFLSRTSMSIDVLSEIWVYKFYLQIKSKVNLKNRLVKMDKRHTPSNTVQKKVLKLKIDRLSPNYDYEKLTYFRMRNLTPFHNRGRPLYLQNRPIYITQY